MVDGDTKTYSDDTDTEYSKNVCMTSSLEDKPCHFSFRTNVKEVLTVKQINNLFDMDFHEGTQDKFISREDNRFMDIMKKGIHQIENGQFQMPLPFKNPDARLPDNKPAVLKRLNGLKQKLQNDEKYKKHYITFMQNIINHCYSERVPDEELNIQNGKLWYLPHFGTYHPKKPDKLRIVCDASITYNGSCLNNTLLQGPDLINSLLGVLCRFRQERIAFICDIESMFFRFKVNEEHRNYLRFF
ncbi:hypothetical protein SNE40_008915 [Patella caerulea]|uniref:Uncharacterized protein n=1 Tax=Patella caerulea TaxID=87958 RepID=A0AAN8PWX8_PATCE